MSYTNGIGGQQTVNTITPSETQPSVQLNTPETAPEAFGVTIGHADETALSSTSGLVFQSLEGSDTRTAKVLSLQGEIAAGTYNVSSTDVANKIIESLLE